MPWKYGIGKYPNNWDKIKKIVIHNANYKCEECGLKPDNFKKNFNPLNYDNITTQKFRVHHKDRNKSNNEQCNLSFVCQWCHGKLHTEANNEVVQT